MMTATQFQEQINRLTNIAMANIGSGNGTIPNAAAISTILTNAATAVTASNTANITHDRMITDPGSVLNPSQP